MSSFDWLMTGSSDFSWSDLYSSTTLQTSGSYSCVQYNFNNPTSAQRMRFAINFVTANGTTIDGTLYPANGTYTIQSSVSGNMVVNYDANKVGGYWAQAECFENTTGGFYPNAGTVIVETGGDGKPYITFNSTSTILAPTSNKTTNTYKFHIGTPPSSSHDVTITNGNSTYGTLTGTTLMTVDDGSSISITNSGKTLTIDGQSVTATPNDSDYVL